jgi:hypothetical protein
MRCSDRGALVVALHPRRDRVIRRSDTSLFLAAWTNPAAVLILFGVTDVLVVDAVG